MTYLPNILTNKTGYYTGRKPRAADDITAVCRLSISEG